MRLDPNDKSTDDHGEETSADNSRTPSVKTVDESDAPQHSDRDLEKADGVVGEGAAGSGGAALTATATRSSLARTKSNVAPRVDQAGPPPNGGTIAWMQVVGSFFLFFNSWYSVQLPTA